MPLRKKRNQLTPPPPRGLYDEPFFFFVLTPCVIGLLVVRIADDDETEMMLEGMKGASRQSDGSQGTSNSQQVGRTRGTQTPGP